MMDETPTISDAPVVVGVTAADAEPDESAVYLKMCAAYAEEKALEDRRRAQSITFQHGPVCLVEIADLHMGGNGVDYERVFREAEIIRDTPGMWLLLNGDLVENFILSKLVHARFKQPSSIPEEWALVRKYLRTVGKKLLVSVRGNHEAWNEALTGVDYFEDVLSSINKAALYDAYDCRFTLKVGKAEFANRVRHKWRGTSIYNLTHNIERAFLFDHDFRVGWAAHIHAAGVVRQFNASGITGMAVLAGTYKVIDPYARQGGFARPNQSTAPAVIFEEDGNMIGTDSLEQARKIMQALK